MRPVSITKTLAAASANNIALTQTPVSGTALTLAGSTVTAGVATLDTARRVLLTFGNEASNRTLVLTGTDGANSPITETLTVVSGAGGTIASLQDFLTITRALPLGGGWTAAVTLGTSATGSTQWFVPSQHITPFELTFGTVLVSGTPTWTIEASLTDVKAPVPLGLDNQRPVPIPAPIALAGLSALVANTGPVTVRDTIQGFRLTLTVVGSVQMNATQAGLRQ